MKDDYFEKALEWVKAKPFFSIKANFDGYESTKIFKSTSSEEEIQADISFQGNGGVKHYTDIAVKTSNTRNLVTRWKLLSLMASIKRGKLYLLAPKGHKMFTERLVEKNNINALVYSL